MPELPEVEVTRRSLADSLQGARVRRAELGLPLRWPLGRDPAELAGLRVGVMARRGKYLWLPLMHGHPQAALPPSGEGDGQSWGGPAALADLAGLPRIAGGADDEGSGGGLLIHLGMSGALSLVEPDAPAGPYDHFLLRTDRGCLRLTDPRRFGAVVWASSIDEEPARKLLAGLGPEPFDPALDAEGFHAGLKARRAPVKTVLLSGELVVGAGNIYACEALFRAGIDPRTPGHRISRPRAARLLEAVRSVLAQAIDAGGSTLKDFNANGAAGHYQEHALVYARGGQPCLRCSTPIRRIVQGQRSTFYCPVCQKR